MTLALGVGGGLAGLVAVAWIAGSLLPADHVAQMAIDLSADPRRVWEVISDLHGTAAWRSDVRRVEPADPVAGRERFVEVTAQGRTPFEIVTREAPARQVVRVVDDGLPFGGTWTWNLAPAGTGTRLTITEDGFVRNPIFRLMGRLFFPPTATMRTYLGDLSAMLGARSEPELLRAR